MKAYIYAPDEGYTGEGVYGLVAEDGEPLGSHYCSNRGYARHDLTEFESRKKVLAEKGVTEVLWLGDDEMTWGEIARRNAALVATHTPDAPVKNDSRVG